MNKYIKIFLCVCFVLFANCVVCYASTLEALNTAEYLEMYSGMSANTINSPYQAKESDGYVDTSDANMTVNVEDLYIPGKNGLDLSIKRNFKTGSSPQIYYTVYETNNSFQRAIGYYRVYLCNEKNEKISVFFRNEKEMYEAGDSFKGYYYTEMTTVTKSNRNKYFYLASPDGNYTYTLVDRTIHEATKSMKSFPTFSEYEFDGGFLNIGNGWTIQVPALERYDLYTETGYRECYMIFQDRLGKMYTFNFGLENEDNWELQYVDEPNWNPFVFEFVNSKNIYDVAQHEKGFEYGATITTQNGDIYYFGNFAITPNPTIRAIEDKYGNIITFETTSSEYKITDTYGVEYTINSNGISKKVNNTVTELVKYEWQNDINSEKDLYQEFEIDNEHIFTVTKNTGTSNVISDNEPHKTVYYLRQEYQYEEP